MGAHEQAVAEAREFLREHPEFRSSAGPLDPDTGESARPTKSDWLGSESQHHKHVGLGGFADITRMENDESFDFQPIWFEAGRSRDQRALDVRVEKILGHLSADQRNLLIWFYWERQSQLQIASHLGISQQAVNGRMRTAEKAFVRAIVAYGDRYQIVAEEEL